MDRRLSCRNDEIVNAQLFTVAQVAGAATRLGSGYPEAFAGAHMRRRRCVPIHVLCTPA